jgi:hypothetical protein
MSCIQNGNFLQLYKCVLNALCSVFGITPVDDKTIGMVITVSILHWVFISNASSLYFVSFSVSLAYRL